MSVELLIPDPEVLIMGLRDTGYDTNTALADVVDNSVDANASQIDIRINLDINNNPSVMIADNGCGMNQEELENNLGTIAKSGSLSFKEENANQNDVDIIGQFGVGFYSAFMVSDDVEVISKAYGNNKAYKWKSTGEDGYTIEESSKDEVGTIIKLHLKDDSDDVKYSEYLEEYKIRMIVKKYSDYIRYPIVMEVENRVLKKDSKDEYETVLEDATLNSMLPIWKKDKKDITEDDYNNFYTERFYDYEKPMKVIHTSVEGLCSYNAILYIPSHTPFDLYSKEYEKGLQLYANDVLIMDKCPDLLPDYFNFVKGVVNSQDLSLNISREMLQQDKNVGLIAKNIEHKIKSELEKMLANDRENYKKFFDNFGRQIKFGVYDNYGLNKDKLKDLLLFYSSKEKQFVTLKEYLNKMSKEQDSIYYACGETIDKIDLLPQVELVKDKGYDILYLTDYIDEFVVKTIIEYEQKKFVNICSKDLDLSTDEEKEKLKKTNEKAKKMFDLMKEDLNSEVEEVRYTDRLKKHPVCLTNEGEISVEMEKVMNAMPTDDKVKAKTILEINKNHPIVKKLEDLYKNDKEKLKEYTKIIYAQARLIEGLSIDNPTEISNLICDLISK